MGVTKRRRNVGGSPLRRGASRPGESEKQERYCAVASTLPLGHAGRSPHARPARSTLKSVAGQPA